MHSGQTDSTLWDGEGLEGSGSGVGGLSGDGGGLIVPEDVQLPWVSVCKHTGNHYPVQYQRETVNTKPHWLPIPCLRDERKIKRNEQLMFLPNALT